MSTCRAFAAGTSPILSNPERPPVAVAYPAAGTDNAEVTLLLVDVDGSHPVEVQWDRVHFEYVTTANWSEHGLLVVVQSRDQRTMRILEVDTSTGATSVLREDADDAWVDIVNGVPARLRTGRSCGPRTVTARSGCVIGDDAVTGTDLEVRDVVDVDGDVVVFRASTTPTEVGVYTWSRAGGVSEMRPEGVTPGVWRARRCGWHDRADVTRSRALRSPGDRPPRRNAGRARSSSFAETPAIALNVRLVTLGERALRAAVLFPTGHEPAAASCRYCSTPMVDPGSRR